MESSNRLHLFLNNIDEKSRKIYWHFRCYGHAKLAELTKLLGAAADMEVLYRIREIINPAAMECFGKPMLEFYESRMDPVTGNKILFQWWITDFKKEDHLPLVDIFDEENEIIIVSEISPSITISDQVKVEIRHGILYLRLDKLR